MFYPCIESVKFRVRGWLQDLSGLSCRTTRGDLTSPGVPRSDCPGHQQHKSSVGDGRRVSATWVLREATRRP